MEAEIAVIGGTGVYDPSMLTDTREEQVVTPYGNVTLKIGSYGGKPVAFLNRHGEGHAIPPHLVNYRANIDALRKIGVKNILATAAVGSLNLDMQPGHLIFVDQFLDFTKSRQYTFYDGGALGVVHTDMTNPYCSRLRDLLSRVAQDSGYVSHPAGVYVCCEGPRFETAAEIRMYRLLGGDLVGMTGVPEAQLAREAEMCYATIAIATNFAAGISPDRLTHAEVLDMMGQLGERIKNLLMQTIALIEPGQPCDCRPAQKDKVLDGR